MGALLAGCAIGVLPAAKANAFIGGSFDSCAGAAHSVVLTEVRKLTDGKLAMVVIQTLKGHPPKQKTLAQPVPRDSHGARYLVLLDGKGRLLDEDVDDGCTNTAEVKNGWVQTEVGVERKDGESLESFKRRMVALSQQKRRDRSEAAALRECLKGSSKRCEVLPRARRTDIEMEEMEAELSRQLKQAAAACKLFSVMLSAELVVHPDGRAEVNKLAANPAHSPAPQEDRLDCIRRGLSSSRFRPYAGPPVNVGLGEYIFWPATKEK